MKSRFLFLGPPGAGKGTQANLLAKEESLLHLSTGELLRAEVSAGSKLGQEAALIMDRGELVSDEIVLAIVQKKLSDIKTGWLLDGFPRNILQANGLQELLDKISQPLEAVIFIELKDELLIERLLARGRTDDNEEVIRNRLKVYREQTSPLINHYNDLGILHTVKGLGKIEDVASLIRQAIGSTV